MIEQKKPIDFTLVYRLIKTDEWRNEAATGLRDLADKIESGLSTDGVIELMRLNKPKENSGYMMFSFADKIDDEGDDDLSLDDIEPISQQEFVNALSHVVLTPTEDGDAMILSLPKKHQSKGGE